jgi:5'-methylthioadenosine phosphorylase
VVLAACEDEGVTTHPEGTVVVMAGPRFSTRAESQWYTDQGWHVIGMTQMPEAALAAELGVPFAGIALVTDYDAGLAGAPGTEPVTMEEVFAMVERNAERVRGVLFRAIELLDENVLASTP